jgi:hypothetical protein
MYLGMTSVYLEKICRLTGTNNSNTTKINRNDRKLSIKCSNLFMGKFWGARSKTRQQPHGRRLGCTSLH